jgi:hypothetical protein
MTVMYGEGRDISDDPDELAKSDAGAESEIA